ncbi:hypothetical protein DC094_07810 [Pelagibaculum spongiae]|uniref:Uncharacterized protein n=1 Tax=Pelagibaculum spongiae TaxID=2080658 RepID=A0A2V1H396_9GAMM|nr:hypothetical protein DC094_07810 [Pelagibaculum spongiae]
MHQIVNHIIQKTPVQPSLAAQVLLKLKSKFRIKLQSAFWQLSLSGYLIKVFIDNLGYHCCRTDF